MTTAKPTTTYRASGLPANPTPDDAPYVGSLVDFEVFEWYSNPWFAKQNSPVLFAGTGGEADILRDRNELRIRVRHYEATDFEHDRSSLMDLTVLSPVVEDIDGYTSIFSGVLLMASAYPNGTDITQLPHDGIPAGEFCEACKTPHPFAPYSAPDLDFTPRRVTIYVHHKPKPTKQVSA
jgi:hypothetical protein